MSGQDPDSEHLLTPSEVAALFRVDPKTVTRWAKAGKLTSIRTLGGHRRYRASEVHALLAAQSPAPQQQTPQSPQSPRNSQGHQSQPGYFPQR
ncbi:MAG: BldC family transcriptional regulator [Actinomycetota bacterium]|nr:BldC family transcriptional regulator [Actinomycetota bacterium]